MSDLTDITDFNASELSERIHQRQVSCTEVMLAYLARIERMNPRFNAIVNLAPTDMLLAQARQCDAELASGQSRGWLHGIPQAIKDTGHAVGFPTTLGSTLLKAAMPTKDSIMTERMKAAGALVIGKTNMPELGLGSHTFNTLFGATANAWDTAVSAGGSSGGAAVALAQRLLPVADGSDFMGSLRNPAGWNHIFGMRPSQGRVPFGPGADVWVDQLGTEGPMARSVRDLTRLLATQSGHDARQPLSIKGCVDVSGLQYSHHALRGLRVGWLGDLNGRLAMEDGILPVCEEALRQMQGAGAVVEPRALGFDAQALWDCWLVWRRALVGPKVAALLHMPDAQAQLKPEALWEHENSVKLSYMDFMQASQMRSAFYQHLLDVFKEVDVLALPVAQTWPFALQERWPQHIGARTMDTYHRWMECTLYATLAGLPAISLPAGFHPTHGWPMGLQLIGKPQGDVALLQVAAAYEAVRGDWLQKRPAQA
ncbi:amidase [Limnohabitans sp.]|jgi:amidase|uniref:amidase n=1 Tax=Limnohabitans sp. TaxID=1907725 RepID=UPI0037C08D6C